jgi:hypothetical protein
MLADFTETNCGIVAWSWQVLQWINLCDDNRPLVGQV